MMIFSDLKIPQVALLLLLVTIISQYFPYLVRGKMEKKEGSTSTIDPEDRK